MVMRRVTRPMAMRRISTSTDLESNFRARSVWRLASSRIALVTRAPRVAAAPLLRRMVKRRRLVQLASGSVATLRSPAVACGVTARSAGPGTMIGSGASTFVSTVAVRSALSRSLVEDDSTIGSETTLSVVIAAAIFAVSENAAEPTAKPAFVQVIVPAEPTAGVVHDHPAGVDTDPKPRSLGSVAVSVASTASKAPPFVAPTVYVTSAPGATEGADPIAFTDRSAVGVGQADTALAAIVTIPLRERARPLRVAPAPAVMAALASRSPVKLLLAPSVTAPATGQNTFGAQVSLPAPVLITVTAAPAAGFSAALILNRKKAFGSPPRSSVRVPVIAMAAPAQ